MFEFRKNLAPIQRETFYFSLNFVMTEADLQNAIYSLRERHGHKLICPNVGLFYGVSDVISITQANFAVDHEIKLTRSDFKNEFKSLSKIRKHNFLDWTFNKVKNRGHYSYCPNYFFYVVPAFLIEPHEVQNYAGLLYYYENTNYFEVVKKAKRIHSKTINKRQRQYLERGLMLRYWKKRIKEKL